MSHSWDFLPFYVIFTTTPLITSLLSSAITHQLPHRAAELFFANWDSGCNNVVVNLVVGSAYSFYSVGEWSSHTAAAVNPPLPTITHRVLDEQDAIAIVSEWKKASGTSNIIIGTSIAALASLVCSFSTLVAKDVVYLSNLIGMFDFWQ